MIAKTIEDTVKTLGEYGYLQITVCRDNSIVGVRRANSRSFNWYVELFVNSGDGYELNETLASWTTEEVKEDIEHYQSICY